MSDAPAEAALRQAFRPSRGRASLSALPSSTIPNKENGSGSTSTSSGKSPAKSTRKKRAHSLGGEALQRTVQSKAGFELSPGQQARRKLAPRRSILKATPAIFEGTGDPTATFENSDIRQFASAHTTDLSSLSTFNRRRSSLRSSTVPQQDDDDDEDEDSSDDDNGTMDMDFTRMETSNMDDRRKSMLSRRVSFAPNAHIRTFTPDKPTAQAQALLHAQQQAQAAAAAAAAAAPAEPLAWSSSEEDDDDMDSEPSMEMAGDEITHAFAGHFAGTNMPISALQGNQDDDDDDSESDSDGSMAMDEANTGEITSAFAQQKTSVFNSQQMAGSAPPPSASSVAPVPSAMKTKPRFSEVARQEDAEDEEILRSLGMAKGKGTSADKGKQRSAVMFGGVPSSEGDDEDQTGMVDEDADTEDEGDRTSAMEMTMAVGSVLAVGGSQNTAPSQEEADQDEDEEDGDASMDMSVAEKTMDLDQTADMMDATTYGGIIGVPAPSTPSARLKAELHARQLAQGITPTEKVRNSPRRLANPPSVIDAPPASPRAIASMPKSPRKVAPPIKAVTPVKHSSPAKLVSPVKIPSALKVATPDRARSSPVNAPSSASRASARPSTSAAATATPPRAASPVKTTLTPGRTPRSPFVPRVQAPPPSAGRSPGGSLSLRGLLQEQLARGASQPSPNKGPYPAPSSLAMSPKRAARGSWESPKTKHRVLEMKESEKNEEDLTGSSFGAYMDEPEQAPAPILSLDEFFDATGTGFMKDVLGMTGVELGSKRRRSMAPSASGRTPSGPPSFADLAVAGGCKSLFHQLYQSDHLRLQEEITNVMTQLAQCEDALQFEQPKVFTEWATATEAHRAIMQGQFRMIKAHYYLVGRIEWNECRAQNHQAIIEVMEDNLEGLRADNAVVAETDFATVLPNLEARRAALLAELHAERQRDVELSACDQEELAGMHAAIAEQAEELEKLEQGCFEVESRLEGLEKQEMEHREKVEKSKAECDALRTRLEEGRCFSKAEVFRLQAEYDALQHLNGWQLTQFSKSSVSLRHLDEFDVTLTLGPGKVEDASFAFTPVKKMSQLEAEVTRFLFDKVVSNVQDLVADDMAPSRRAKTILQRIDTLWTGARRLRYEILNTHRRFPTTSTRLSASHQQEVLRIASEIHVPVAKATFFVTFDLSGEELIDDEERPAEVEMVVQRIGDLRVEVKFGRVNAEDLRITVGDIIDVGGRGALIEACKKAERAAERQA
ncbi:Spc7 kinetochore protein-domain-containing protein [Leucosporidium creatinivorum]|uniref:Spc7 kinetochore protein-domain-containing protein n=1 Tax=Leucosporidium creatinivorum TaxID=106004 RepID=A0A1Y2ERD0_9BASI|nr:Spc7 kinetochore protein-domain-containing protein [Leucosporidium creatinivorum]